MTLFRTDLQLVPSKMWSQPEFQPVFHSLEGASDVISYRSPVNTIKDVVPARVPSCFPQFGSTFLDVNITDVIVCTRSAR